LHRFTCLSQWIMRLARSVHSRLRNGVV
jgi:hypothetical protein